MATTDVPSMAMSPAVGVSKPAIIIRVDVLPDPLGPRRVRNSPERMSSDTPSTALTRSYFFTRSASVTDAPRPAPFMPASPISFSSAATC